VSDPLFPDDPPTTEDAAHAVVKKPAVREAQTPPTDPTGNETSTETSLRVSDGSTAAENLPTPVTKWGDEAPVPLPVQGAADAAATTSPKRATPPGMRATNRPRPGIAVRIFATFALVAAVTTYVAVEVDLIRRHFPGVDPLRYWLPQLQQVTLPGLGAVAICALVALAIHKLQRRRT
jgi:hypothetical protein